LTSRRTQQASPTSNRAARADSALRVDRASARTARISERRRRRAAGIGLLILVLAVLVGGAYAGLKLAVPSASIEITATPEDAVISITGPASTEATGTLSIPDAQPGTYEVNITRKGFAPLVQQLDVLRGEAAGLSAELTPLTQEVTIVAVPADSIITAAHNNGEVLTGVGSISGELPSGPVELTINCDGRESCNEAIFLDEPLSMKRYLDLEGQLVHLLTRIKTSGAPKGVSITPDGKEVWTSILNGPPSIEIFDSITGEKTGEVDIGKHGAVEVIFSRDGTKAYTSQMETAKCFEIDVASRTVLREFDTESAWTKWVELSHDETKLFASNWSGHDVSFIDLATGKTEQRVRVSQTPRGMYATLDGKSLYVAGFDSGHLERIDIATGSKKVLFTGGGALRHIVADEGVGFLYISDMSKNLIWRHDLSTGETTKFCETDQKPNTIALSPDARVLFISCRGANHPTSYYLKGPEWGSILLIDTSTGKGLDAIVAGNQPTALDVSADGQLLVYSDFLDDQLSIYQVPNYETLSGGSGGRFSARLKEIRK